MGIENLAHAKLRGVSRDAENEKALILHFDRPLTDDEVRYLHEAYKLIVESVMDAEAIVSRAPRTMQ